MRISDWSSDVCSSDLRFFTYITSIAEEKAFFANGSSAGFGVLMAYDGVNQRIIIAEAYEGAPAFAAGIDRGTAIVGIGTNRSEERRGRERGVLTCRFRGFAEQYNKNRNSKQKRQWKAKTKKKEK